MRSETAIGPPPGEPLLGRGRTRPSAARRSRRTARCGHRRRRDERADRAGARRARRRDDLRRQPPRRPRAARSPSASAARSSASTGCPSQLEAADIVLASTSSPHPIVGREELELVMAAARGPAAAADRHRRAPRHRSALRRSSRASRCATSTTFRRPSRATSQAVPPTSRAAEEIIGEEIQRFAKWLGQLDVRPTIGALRERGERDRRARARRERGPLGVRLGPRPGARRGARASGRGPPAARADDPPAKPRSPSAATAASSCCASCLPCAGRRDAGGGRGNRLPHRALMRTTTCGTRSGKP